MRCSEVMSLWSTNCYAWSICLTSSTKRSTSVCFCDSNVCKSVLICFWWSWLQVLGFYFTGRGILSSSVSLRPCDLWSSDLVSSCTCGSTDRILGDFPWEDICILFSCVLMMSFYRAILSLYLLFIKLGFLSIITRSTVAETTSNKNTAQKRFAIT